MKLFRNPTTLIKRPPVGPTRQNKPVQQGLDIGNMITGEGVMPAGKNGSWVDVLDLATTQPTAKGRTKGELIKTHLKIGGRKAKKIIAKILPKKNGQPATGTTRERHIKSFTDNFQHVGGQIKNGRFTNPAKREAPLSNSFIYSETTPQQESRLKIEA